MMRIRHFQKQFDPYVIDIVDGEHIGVDIVDVELARHAPHPLLDLLQSGAHLKSIKI